MVWIGGGCGDVGHEVIVMKMVPGGGGGGIGESGPLITEVLVVHSTLVNV